MIRYTESVLPRLDLFPWAHWRIFCWWSVIVTQEPCDPWRIMYFRWKLVMAYVYECYQYFHDVKSALFTVISNYHKVRVLLKVINSKLNLIHGSIRKRTRNRQKSVFHRKFLIIYIVSVSLRFGACYITSQWGDFRIKHAPLCFHILFGIFLLFFDIEFVLLSFSFLFSQQSINQSETGTVTRNSEAR